jgi:PRTRC genetic system protein E
MNNYNESQPGLFRQLEPMLADRAVLITVSALEGNGGRLQVNICPRLLKEGENKALTVPLSVTGTAAELDAELVSQVAAYVDSHSGLATNLNQIQAEVAEAEKMAREEAKKKKNVGNGGKKVEPAAKDAKDTKADPPPQQPLGLFDAATEQQPVE